MSLSLEPFARAVLREIDDKIRTLDRMILAGSISDFAAYKGAIGHLRGLEEARAIIVDSLGEAASPTLKQRPLTHD